MTIYLDESGDLGFRVVGSDHFVITFMTMDNAIRVKRVVRRTKRRYKLSADYEIKGNKTPAEIRKDLLQRLSRVDIEFYSIVMKKANVPRRLQHDTNILYNYVLGLVLVPYLIKQQDVSIIVDKRTVSVTSGLKLDEYLKYRVWYENLADVEMRIYHEDSKRSLGIQAVDVVCNSIFKKYESGNTEYYELTQQRIREEKRLFF